MPDAKEWIGAIRSADPPELWADVCRRAEGGPLEPEISPRRLLSTVAVLVAALAMLGSVLYGLRNLGEGTTTTLAPGEIVRYRLDGPPQPLAVGEGAAWVHIGAGDETTNGLVRIDARTGERRTVDTPGGEWPAVGGGSAWLLCNSSACEGGSLVQLDPVTGAIERTVRLPGRGAQIAGTVSGVWVTHDTGVSFINPEGVVARTFTGSYNLVGTDGTSLWVSGPGGATALDPLDGHEIAHVPFADVCTMEVADGLAWMASCDGGRHEGVAGDELMGVDAATGEVLFRRTIDGYGQMRYAGGVLWLAQSDPSDADRIRLLSFDPRTGAQLTDPIVIPRDPAEAGGRLLSPSPPHVFFAVGEGSLWLTDFAAFEVIRMGVPDPSSPVVTTETPVASPALVLAEGNAHGIPWTLVAVGGDTPTGLELRWDEPEPRTESVGAGLGISVGWGHFGDFDPDDDVVFGVAPAEAVAVKHVPGYGLPETVVDVIDVPGVEWNAFVISTYAAIGTLTARTSSGAPSWELLIVPPGCEAALETAEAFLDARRAGEGAEAFLTAAALDEFGRGGVSGLYAGDKGGAYASSTVLFIEGSGQRKGCTAGVRLKSEDGTVAEDTLFVEERDGSLMILAVESGVTGP